MELLISGATEPCPEKDDFVNVESWDSTLNLPKASPVVIKNSIENHRSLFQSSHSTLHPPIDRKGSFGISVESAGQDDDYAPESTEAYAARAPYPRNDRRTILISNLSDRTTHKDLEDILRGGRLLDIYLRSDRTATVSFVEGASDFIAYAKRKDFYLHGKRLGISWNDRQFHLPYHVANKIQMGATRNLVVRSINFARHSSNDKPPITEESIRDDLEHIHNLVVISVAFDNGDCYISTNSVHNALFARTCMMSRATYKGLRIEWYPDKCAAPIPVSQRKPKDSWSTPNVAQLERAPLTNMFELLGMDDTEDASSDADTEGPGLYSPHGCIGMDWANGELAA